MEGLADILDKLSTEDCEKLRMLFSINNETSKSDVVTLRVFCDEYRNLIMNNRSKNYYGSVCIALNHLTDYFGLQKPIGSITLKDVELFIIDLQKKVVKGYRVYYRTLKAAFNKAVDWDYVENNHFIKIKLPKKQRVRPGFISSDQLLAISGQLEEGVVRDVIVFAFYTGMRLSEIVNLRWRNVDLEQRVITVGDKEFTTKSRRQRVVPMCGEVFELLSRRLRTPSSVLPLEKREEVNWHVFGKSLGSTRDRYTGDYFSRKFKRACRAVGMDESIHFHSLRHSFASHLAQQGVSLYVIKELLGHSSISTTEVYSHLNMDSLRGAVEKLSKPPLNLPLNNGEIYKKEGVDFGNGGLRLVVNGKTD